MGLVGIVNIGISTLTLIADILIVFFILIELFSAVFKKNIPFWKNAKGFFRGNALLFAFLFSIVATLGSLAYSEIIGYLPCKLCWYQRILMYPQVVILGIALWKKDVGVRKYVIPLSIIGGIIAIFHYMSQRMASAICTGEAVNCSFSYVSHYGYITIPIMSLTAFVGILILMILKKGKK